ncbi:hypothetical protein GGR56DRAFT_676977 [Xylariaceae sp. FL0804]|nr:hypothetical protein GGR56DRAFT_676977 [Xylariaceae sp. FL0804]
MALPFAAPPSLSPAFALSWATPADLDAMIDVYYRAFVTDVPFTFWWPRGRAQTLAFLRAHIGNKLRDEDEAAAASASAAASATRSFQVRETATGELVAWCRWAVPEGHRGGEGGFGARVAAVAPGARQQSAAAVVDVSRVVESEPEQEPETAAVAGPGDSAEAAAALGTPGVPLVEGQGDALAPAGSESSGGVDEKIAEVRKDFLAAIEANREKWKAETMLCLSVLCTAPDYHRRGTAKALLLPMLAIADARGLRTYLEASEMGRPLYRALGFRDVGDLVFDTSRLAGEGYGDTFTIKVMIREPKTTTTTTD